MVVPEAVVVCRRGEGERVRVGRVKKVAAAVSDWLAELL